MKITETLTNEIASYFDKKIENASLCEESHNRINDVIQDTIEQIIDKFFDGEYEIEYIIENDTSDHRTQRDDYKDCEEFVTKYQLGGKF